MDIENKNSYFIINLDIAEENRNSNRYNEELNDSIDLIFNAIEAEEIGSYNITKNDRSKQKHIFRTKKRKRKGQLSKYCERFLTKDTNLEYSTEGVTKDHVNRLISELENRGDYNIEHQKSVNKIEYDGPDTRIFKDKKNWHEWQKNIYEMLYDEKGEVKVPDDREIISIIDYEGKSGKSSWYKFLFCQDPKSIGRLVYGSASQLRSAAINNGEKKIYIIDLSRTKGKEDSEKEILAVCEEIKSGFVVNPMYGKGSTLVMHPPHVIISSNYKLSYELLSNDRWGVYEIDRKTKKLGKKNYLLRKQERVDTVKK
jgi:hypothetical protein